MVLYVSKHHKILILTSCFTEKSLFSHIGNRFFLQFLSNVELCAQ